MLFQECSKIILVFFIRYLLRDVGNDFVCGNGYFVFVFDIVGNRLVFLGEVDDSFIDFSYVNVEIIYCNQGDDGNVYYED